MGLNNIGALRFVVDIETYPIDNAGAFLDLTQFTAPANYKDPEKIAVYVAEQQAAAVAKAALDLDLCRIVALGYMREDERDPTVALGTSDAVEALTLHTFWDELDNRVTVGYNTLGFDLPVLLRRSLYLGVPAPALNLDKYRSPHIDLQQRLSLHGTKPYRSLSWYCTRFGLDVPNDPTSGKDIAQLVAAGDWEGVRSHCQADVLKTKALALRLGVLSQQPVALQEAF